MYCSSSTVSNIASHFPLAFNRVHFLTYLTFKVWHYVVYYNKRNPVWYPLSQGRLITLALLSHGLHAHTQPFSLWILAQLADGTTITSCTGYAASSLWTTYFSNFFFGLSFIGVSGERQEVMGWEREGMTHIGRSNLTCPWPLNQVGTQIYVDIKIKCVSKEKTPPFSWWKSNGLQPRYTGPKDADAVNSSSSDGMKFFWCIV